MPADAPMPATHGRTVRRILAVAAMLALVVLVYGMATRVMDARRLRERTDVAAVPTVSVVTPQPAGAAAALELPGRVEAYARAPIYARVSGYLKAWYADIGASVHAGQLLAEIETPDLDQQLLQAEAELADAKANAALAEATAKRWQALLASDSVSQQEVDEKATDSAAKKSQVKALQANVERYQALKRFTRIVAPFDGIVTKRSTDVGSLINVGSAQGPELFVVSDLRRLRVYVNVPQNYTGDIRPGTKATLSVPEHAGKQYGAAVQSMSHAIDPESGSMLVQLTADNAGSELLPGGFARVRFEVPPTAGALAVPSSALIFDKSGLRVATMTADGTVALKRVVLSRDLGATIELSSGLAADDKVIENPPDGIGDGDPVRLAAAPASSAAAPTAAGQDGHARH